jgi:hypothetical protein
MVQFIQKAAAHIQKVLEEMSTNVRTACFMRFLNKYELHCDEVQLFLGIFQQIAPALNRHTYCHIERRILQEQHVPKLNEP